MILPLDNRALRLFRWAVFLLNAGYVLRHFVWVASYDAPGGPFRYLTFWALLLSFAAASRMLAITEGRSHRDWSALVAVTATVNALVVLVYWRLWFTDPNLVNSGAPGPWYDEYYLHLAGPLLQWIDAVFLFGAFRRVLPALGLFLVAVLAYVFWAEFFVGPFNMHPAGSVTSGLPYPFLNNMQPDERIGFYVTTAVTGLVFLAVLWIASWAARRVLGVKA